MFIFQRPFQAVAAGLGVALLMAYLGSHYDGIQPARSAAPNTGPTARLVPVTPLGVSSAPVRDLSLSCRLPPASFASWLPGLKSRIVPDQVAVRAPTTQPIFGMRSC
jgi:hypothetical protein